MIHGKKWDFAGVFFCKKPHFCPHCSNKLVVVNKQKVVNSRSEEAKEYDFSMPGGDGYLLGNVQFHWREFYCPHCHSEIPIAVQKQHERQLRKNKVKT